MSACLLHAVHFSHGIQSVITLSFSGQIEFSVHFCILHTHTHMYTHTSHMYTHTQGFFKGIQLTLTDDLN